MGRSSRIVGALALSLAASTASAIAASELPRRLSLDDYKHFRIESIDLLGRMPTRDEIAAFERANFNEEQWIDTELASPAFAERMTRLYMDLLRLEPNINFSPGPSQLYRQEISGPDGKPVLVFYRDGQRRLREETDGDFCLSPDETGLVIRHTAQPVGTPKPVKRELLEKYTTLVKPWWLYRDYASPNATLRFSDAGASGVPPEEEFKLAEGLATGSDGKRTLEVRVCKEEASTNETGHVHASGRTRPDPEGAKPKGGRLKPAPRDRAFATKHKGEAISCGSKTALEYAVDCGCGTALERCLPNDGPSQGSAFFFPNHLPLGPDLPLRSVKQQAQRWFPHWWSQEAVKFLMDLFANDRDFREILTGHQTFVNGPLSQFYSTIQRGECCGPETNFGMTEETEPLFDPKNVPHDLDPEDVAKWERVADRGPRAAGILTLPMFLEKYASARARAAAVYSAFLCKSFTADKNTELTASTEPNLMIRAGCSSCHATLEPLAAYFARIEPGNFVFLPPSLFPAHNTTCKKDKSGKLNGPCNALYDVAFADDKGAMLRSAYASPAHADATPVGAAIDVTKSPDFASCAVQRVASSFLGRPTTEDDAPWLHDLGELFVRSGFRVRPLVRAIVKSPLYRKANNTDSDVWREQAGGGAAHPETK